MTEKVTSNSAKQLLKFIFAGVITTLIHFIILSVLFIYLGCNIVVSTIWAFLIAIIFSYSMNYQFTYQSKELHQKSMPKFFCSTLLGLFWNISLMYFLVEYLGQKYFLAFLLVTLVVTINNFLLTKYWVFKS